MATAVAALALVAGCATTAPRQRGAEPAAKCHDAKFSGVFDSSLPDEGPRRIHVRARACRDGRVYIEVRGSIGSPVLYAAVSGERLRLVLPKARRAVEGLAADRELWLSETGLPFDGRLLRALLSGEEVRSVGGWEVDLGRAPGARFPPKLVARHADGARLTLERRMERVADEPPVWPEIPAGFERVSYDRDF